MPKTTILMLAAKPLDTARLALDKQYREIKNALRLASNRAQFALENESHRTLMNRHLSIVYH